MISTLMNFHCAEVGAIGAALGEGSAVLNIALVSVKSYCGHTEGAAGMKMSLREIFLISMFILGIFTPGLRLDGSIQPLSQQHTCSDLTSGGSHLPRG
jgi:3-oxoacyl-(acyl-carrier-protein) synthase